MKPVLKQSFLLHCPAEFINFSAIVFLTLCIEISGDVSARKLKRHEASIAIICRKNSPITKKRQLLPTGRGIKLLKLIEFSVLNHLRKGLDIKQ